MHRRQSFAMTLLVFAHVGAPSLRSLWGIATLVADRLVGLRVKPRQRLKREAEQRQTSSRTAGAG